MSSPTIPPPAPRLDSDEERSLLRAERSDRGAWSFTDRSGLAGGTFRDRAALIRFVRREYGKTAAAQLVEQTAGNAA